MEEKQIKRIVKEWWNMSAQIKERPIIFSPDMVKAILNGSKSQTRRVIKPQPEIRGFIDSYGELAWSWYWKEGTDYSALLKADYGADYVHTSKDSLIKAILAICPYGQIGDRLWVRETLVKSDHAQPVALYAVDNSIVKAISDDGSTHMVFGWIWKPKILPALFMPRWASRITLEITEVRVEKVQEIPLLDVKKEGISEINWYHFDNAINAFGELWDSLNAKRGYGWDTNPWCWCISFKVIDK